MYLELQYSTKTSFKGARNRFWLVIDSIFSFYFPLNLWASLVYKICILFIKIFNICLLYIKVLSKYLVVQILVVVKKKPEYNMSYFNFLFIHNRNK